MRFYPLIFLGILLEEPSPAILGINGVDPIGIFLKLESRIHKNDTDSCVVCPWLVRPEFFIHVGIWEVSLTDQVADGSLFDWDVICVYPNI